MSTQQALLFAYRTPSGSIAKALDEAAAEKSREDARRQAGNWLRMARTCAQAGKYQAARKYYQRVMDDYPDTDEAITAKLEMADLPK